MAVIQISKIQLRRGLSTDLPGAPTGSPPVPSPGLDPGELGFATETGQLFIGADTSNFPNSASRVTFPYQNIEVITEFSPLIAAFAPRPPVTLSNVSSGTTAIPGVTFPVTQNGASIQYTLSETTTQTVRRGELVIATDGTMAGTVLGNSFTSNDPIPPLQVSFTATLVGPLVQVNLVSHEVGPLNFVFTYRIL
jgi:hypothetical protein